VRRFVLLKNTVELYDDSEELMVYIPEGTICEVLMGYVNKEYHSGIAVVIFDGQEAVSVDSSMIEEVESQCQK
jgi:hypothetical protein